MKVAAPLAALALAASCLVGGVTTATATPLPGVSKFCNGRPAVRRHYIVMAGCAGAPPIAEHVVWTRLTRTVGKAHGEVLLDNCKPDCASGVDYFDFAAFTFYRVREVEGVPAFTRVVVDFVGARNNLLGLPRHNVWAVSITY